MRMIVVALAGTLSALACSGSPTGPSGPRGTLHLMLTDSPFTDATSVLVTFSEVTAHRDTDDGVTTVPFAERATSRTCDLKKLETAQDVLGVGTLPAGHYTQLRLVVSSATIYFENAAGGNPCAPTIAAPSGRSAPLDIPSGEVKLTRPFDVAADGDTTMVLDFDGDRSIHQTGNGRYMMRPVIAVVGVQ
jgi:hypothetical protein